MFTTVNPNPSHTFFFLNTAVNCKPAFTGYRFSYFKYLTQVFPPWPFQFLAPKLAQKRGTGTAQCCKCIVYI